VTGRPGEAELIARFLAPLASHPAALGLGDDAAALAPPPGQDLVLTADAVARDVHFLDDSADAIARKALRVNLSDLAAKGAAPLGYLLTLGLEADWTEDWLAAFCAGLAADQETYGMRLLGGDTIRAPGGLVVSITAIGTVPAGRMVRRNGARAGDVLLVTGTIGDAALGLRLRRDPGLGARLTVRDAAHLLGRYRLPEPRVAAASAVLAHARAAMDLSDGLVGDAGKMAAASGVRLVIDAAAVPLSAAARTLIAGAPDLLTTALTGGDDYEILAAVPGEALSAVLAAFAAAGVPATPIGRVEPGAGVALRGATLGRGPSAFSHF